MYPMELKTLPPPNNNQENENHFGKLKENWAQYPNPPVTSIGPLNQTLTAMLGKLTRLQKQEKE